MGHEDRLKELGVTLPPPPQPRGAYTHAVKVGNLLFISGQLPSGEGGVLYTGKVGGEITLEEGQAAARQAVLNALAVIGGELGTLDRVERIVKMVVYVASAPGFIQQPQVANGASELLLGVFGEKGRHTRVAVGAAELPLGASVELELIAEVR